MEEAPGAAEEKSDLLKDLEQRRGKLTAASPPEETAGGGGEASVTTAPACAESPSRWNGERVPQQGPNGAGKSSLLKLGCCQELPQYRDTVARRGTWAYLMSLW